MNQGIPSEYKGINMRSLAEKKWAIALDKWCDKLNTVTQLESGVYVDEHLFKKFILDDPRCQNDPERWAFVTQMMYHLWPRTMFSERRGTVTWLYEPFELKGYIPDFVVTVQNLYPKDIYPPYYVPHDILVEVKGGISTSDELNEFKQKIIDSGWKGCAILVGNNPDAKISNVINRHCCPCMWAMCELDVYLDKWWPDILNQVQWKGRGNN